MLIAELKNYDTTYLIETVIVLKVSIGFKRSVDKIPQNNNSIHRTVYSLGTSSCRVDKHIKNSKYIYEYIRKKRVK